MRRWRISGSWPCPTIATACSRPSKPANPRPAAPDAAAGQPVSALSRALHHLRRRSLPGPVARGVAGPLKLRLDSLPRSSPVYDSLYRAFAAAPTAWPLPGGAGTRPSAALGWPRNSCPPRIDSLRQLMARWKDSTYRGYDSITKVLGLGSRPRAASPTAPAPSGRATHSAPARRLVDLRPLLGCLGPEQRVVLERSASPASGWSSTGLPAAGFPATDDSRTGACAVMPASSSPGAWAGSSLLTARRSVAALALRESGRRRRGAATRQARPADRPAHQGRRRRRRSPSTSCPTSSAPTAGGRRWRPSRRSSRSSSRPAKCAGSS